MGSRVNRRQWVLAVAAAPAFAQTTSTVPPQGAPIAAASESTPAAKLNKALSEVQASSARLSAMAVPMNVEPAFVFKVLA